MLNRRKKIDILDNIEEYVAFENKNNHAEYVIQDDSDHIIYLYDD